ncbi:hypothetical protein Vafri_20491 [Volvox africanus]|uniref:Cyclic nucleotide-binding domain-containing protein n=2 Tax=Volvox africanus TaxID=51714 RepID=A0A8J4BSB7_9CHLO|nr:hypothetical protein Vafri_20491 [Volvox africanus]
MARGPSPSPASAPIISLRDRTPHRPGRGPSGGGSSGHGASAPQPPSQQQLPSPPRSRPVSGSGPLKGAARRLPDYNVRAYCGGYKDQQQATSSGLGPVDAMSLRRHSVSAPVAPGSPVGYPPVTSQMLAQHSQNRNSPQYGQGGGAGSAEGGAPDTPSRRQHRPRRRSSHVTADELLDRFGVVPRALGERTEALYEDVVMPGSISGHASTAATTAAAVATAGQDSGDLPSGSSSDSEGGSGTAPSSPVGLPPVIGSRSPSITHLQGGWAAAAAAAIGGSGSGSGSPATALPVWQARAPRQLVQGQELVFVELGVLTAGQCFGEVRSDGVTVRTSSAVCDTRTEVLAISRNELHQRMGGRVFEYLWNQVPNDGPQASMDSATEAGHCAQQLERSMQWTLFKQKLVADVITQKEQRRRIALKCR